MVGFRGDKKPPWDGGNMDFPTLESSSGSCGASGKGGARMGPVKCWESGKRGAGGIL